MSKSALVICKKSPWSSITARETLDIALAGGAFGLPISMLFLDDGVFQLVKSQHSKAIEQKDLTSNLQALPLFGVETLLVLEESLALRGLGIEQLILPVQLVKQEDLHILLTQYEVVITG